MQQSIILFLFLLLHLAVNAKEIVVCKTCSVSSIEKAIGMANDGDVVKIKTGFYKVNNIVINKRIRIEGEENTVLDGNYNNQIITVTSPDVLVKGLTIQHSGKSDMKDIAGIKLLKVTNCIIRDNIFSDNFFGIYLLESTNCQVVNNNIKGSAKTEASSGNGIHLWKCENMRITGNRIEQHRDGIYFEFVKHSRIANNFSTRNLRYGLHFMFSDGNVYEKNTFTENGAGVAVMYTKNIRMSENIFKNNWGAASYGLLLKDITNSVIVNNTFSKNTTGIYMEGVNMLFVSSNKFENNGWAMKIMGNCENDTLIKNNFTGNSFDVSTNSSGNSNYFDRNYWDKYQGYDLNKDSIGDVPFRPVDLFSMIVDKIPSSIMLLRSFLVDLLNKAEKAIPAFIPESLIDKHPLMHSLQ